jgi:hypothetical protein
VSKRRKVDDTDTAAMLLESAHRFLNRADPGLEANDREFNRRQIYRTLKH